jgi:DNA sulfur modification protein DndE
MEVALAPAGPPSRSQGQREMSLSLLDLVRADFKTSRPADDLNTRFQSLLGMPHRYGPARLAIGRSLALTSEPALEVTLTGYGKGIKGENLFGSGVDLASWVTLIVERSGQENLSRRDLQNFVAAHWHRGIYLLWEDWKASGNDFDAFISRLVHMAKGKRRSATTS